MNTCAKILVLALSLVLGNAFAGTFSPTPPQQYGLNGSWFYRLTPEGPIIQGNGMALEVTYNTFNRSVLVAYWFRVSNISLGPATKGFGTLMLSWSGSANFTTTTRVENLLFLTASSSCQVDEPCSSGALLGSATFDFLSCNEATMFIEYANGDPSQTLYLLRGTEPQFCGSN